MARGKRRVAYRRRHQNRFSLFLVSLVVLMIMVVVAVRSVELQRKIAGYDTQIASLSAQIDAETARAEEIEEYRKYTQTKAYVAFSVGMTCASTILAPVMTPLLMKITAGEIIHVDAVGMFINILIVTIIPQPDVL